MKSQPEKILAEPVGNLAVRLPDLEMGNYHQTRHEEKEDQKLPDGILIRILQLAEDRAKKLPVFIGARRNHPRQ